MAGAAAAVAGAGGGGCAFSIIPEDATAEQVAAAVAALEKAVPGCECFETYVGGSGVHIEEIKRAARNKYLHLA